MAEAPSPQVEKAEQGIVKEDLCDAGFGGNFEIIIDGAIINERSSDRENLGASYEICKKIDQAIIKVLGGIRKDHHFGEIQMGCLLVLLHCFTDEKFSQVFEDITSGEMKEKLRLELLNNGIRTERLVVNIRNREEVETTNAAIQRRLEKKENQEPADGGTASRSEFIPQIIVQGGAYSQKPHHMCISIKDNEYLEIIKDSAKAGNNILQNNGTAIDAVEAAVRILEDSEYFNTGCGSLLTNDGEVECDAMIMDGNTLNTGAVISGRHFKNPVSLAKLIMSDTDHCALSGEGALKFAVEKGFPIFDQPQMIADHVKELKIPYSKLRDYIRNRYKGLPSQPSDTVSAIAMDENGHLACATSTGGVPGRLSGRVSDASLVGCGGYANNRGAATTSGLGESLMKMNLAREVVYLMEGGMNAQDSAKKALENMKKQLKDVGGVVAIDKKGNFGLYFTTEMMGWASIKFNEMKFGLKKDENFEETI
ncbi:isoaspartyl peptidase/L-asparaginase-like [Dendronephthya gigantea]|uniref:isoaspartyl peptidase/L-asparaginase-like n=1 Tax=Dendronephthya gigantea TaxID=151771 RepID=UPI0010699A8E|nr:isoaspartyl peptidase/L-asparaginase-like [Dendronephthya gigantea]XP_028393340.1 isoaspartyl peptidase/L-asparaginase-like [Dendronephthya gigantea]XP_028393341.1 isoaspartyl peptidase/L-asparaginase-like [Dendronephthya gigantea]